MNVFDDIYEELQVKSNAIFLVTDEEIAQDIADTMRRAAYFIQISREALLNIRQMDVRVIGDKTGLGDMAQVADETLQIIRKNERII